MLVYQSQGTNPFSLGIGNGKNNLLKLFWASQCDWRELVTFKYSLGTHCMFSILTLTIKVVDKITIWHKPCKTIQKPCLVSTFHAGANSLFCWFAKLASQYSCRKNLNYLYSRVWKEGETDWPADQTNFASL